MEFDGDKLQGECLLLFDHAAADAHFGASVFWVRRPTAFGGEEAMVEYWQAKRGGSKRGIVEIVEELERTSDYRARRQSITEFNSSSPILKKGLEDQPLPEVSSASLPLHENVRGSHYYN